MLSDQAIAINLLLDIAALTGLLVWTGGAMNPFTTLYLLQVAIAAILVPRRWSLFVTVAAVGAFGALLLARPEAIHVWHSGAMFLLHVRGMWLAFALTAASLWYFIDRVSSALRRRDAELANARVEGLRAERLVALGTLAAGTAHELNTPLGTVAILAAELAERLESVPDARRDLDVIRGEVRRCTEILRQMRSSDVGQEGAQVVDLGEWVRSVVDRWHARHGDTGVKIESEAAAGICRASIRPAALERALHSVLDNARAALSGNGAVREIRVEVAARGEEVAIGVVDHGVGIPAGDLARVGEPFFTTKQPGEGMGLGLFLVNATLAEHSGRLAIRSEAGTTRVELVLPGDSGLRSTGSGA